MAPRIVYWATVAIAGATAAVVATTVTAAAGDAPTSTALPLRTSGPVPTGPPTILDVLQADDDFSILAYTVDAAGVGPLLGDPAATLTVFAPTDGAFMALARALGFNVGTKGAARRFIFDALAGLDGGGDPAPLLASILKYHVTAGAVAAEALVAAGGFQPLQGPRVRLGADNKTLVDAAPSVEDPVLVMTDKRVSNGVIHTLSGVLLPLDVGGKASPASPAAMPSQTMPMPVASGAPAAPPVMTPPPVSLTIAELAGATPNLSLFVKALAAAELVDVVADPSASLTVFAPTNDGFLFLARVLGYPNVTVDAAFPAIVEGLSLLSNGHPRRLLRDILFFHVLPTRKGSASLLGKGFQTTVLGGAINVLASGVIEDAAPVVFDPSIDAPDVQATNGVVHTITRTLWPVRVCPGGASRFCNDLGKVFDPEKCRCADIIEYGPFAY